MPSAGRAITQALASTGAVAPCLYSLVYSNTENGAQYKLHSDHLDTATIKQHLEGVNGTDPSVDIKTLPISIDVVCNIGPQWNYHFYEVPAGVSMTMNSRITLKTSEELEEAQEKFLQEDNFVRHSIEVRQWDLVKSTFNTLELPISQTGGRTRAIVGPKKLYQDSKIQLFGKAPENQPSFIDEKEPTVGTGYSFPKNYSCVFRSQANGIDYNVTSTGKTALVQPDYKPEVWQTMYLSQLLNTTQFPAAGQTIKSDQVNERRVYVENNEVAATLIQWTENNFDYWLTIVSVPPTCDGNFSFKNLPQRLAEWGKETYDKATDAVVDGARKVYNYFKGL